MLEYDKEELVRQATDRTVFNVMNARNDEAVEGGTGQCAFRTAGRCHYLRRCGGSIPVTLRVMGTQDWRWHPGARGFERITT
jgi:hypothetical protein